MQSDPAPGQRQPSGAWCPSPAACPIRSRIPQGCAFYPRCPAPKKAELPRPGRRAPDRNRAGPLGALHAVPVTGPLMTPDMMPDTMPETTPETTQQSPVLLEVKNLKKYFPITAGLLQARRGPRARRRRRQLRHPRGRDAGPGGRVGLRQDHHRPPHPARHGSDRRAGALPPRRADGRPGQGAHAAR